MKNFSENIDFYIDRYDIEKEIFEVGKRVRERGWMNKDEFIAICLWKSRRPKKLFGQNTNEAIKEISENALKETDEVKKITSLTELRGVSIPTASAILAVINPEDYAIIDIRAIQTLNHLDHINWTNITIANWLDFLSITRKLAKTHKKHAREIDKALFSYNRIKLDKEFKNLYNK